MPTLTNPEKVLIVYYSRPGENYWYGGRRTLTIGNTELLVRILADRLDCDVHRIEAVDPYLSEYDATVARNVREQQEDARPGIVGGLPDASGYDTVILASPIWNVRPPMIMSTLVQGLRLDGKTILPVATHAMSGLGRAVTVYAELAPTARIGDGLAVRGEEVAEAASAVERWIGRAIPDAR
ncbi:MAG: hypothetical protein BGO38_11160 [Cellulomonas sp. 73-145]|uniref:flavodoxin n=1 Tax=Cellulomonas sp. 73-145 TaxID=1895739 RepID=UPI00092624BD|nr:flavodoxin [Cellulomonas sp. 73-145]OJV56720.1 MAG: hypothetical protein BGO38_11160 [Cellulomonas sp. 73-145]